MSLGPLAPLAIFAPQVTQEVPNAFAAACDNLAAPFGPVDCIPM